jgi:signal transduction histidine kinase
VSCSEYQDRPSRGDENRISYFPAVRRQADVVSFEEWGKGEILYLHFAVKDTGSGLSGSEKKLLFQRFSQASPRTHVTYGGSGLGLYISKHVVELQGGEIGVSSLSGQGSTFAFWI